MKSLLSRGIDFELKRLIEQAKCWEPEAEYLFDRIGIQPGWKCVDLGCGPIGVLEPLSRRVGSSGQITGLDQNPYCVREVKNFINRNHLANVKVIKGNLFKNSLKPQSFNLSHMRFVFTQLGCDFTLLENMIILTLPGGAIISQESDWTTWNCYPPQPSWEKIKRSLIAFFEHADGDINAGLRIYQMFKQADLSDIQIRTAILAMPVGHPYRSGLVKAAMSMREKILAAQILTENEFTKTIEECNEIIINPNIMIFSYTLCQVWGWVRRSGN